MQILNKREQVYLYSFHVRDVKSKIVTNERKKLYNKNQFIKNISHLYNLICNTYIY